MSYSNGDRNLNLEVTCKVHKAMFLSQTEQCDFYIDSHLNSDGRDIDIKYFNFREFIFLSHKVYFLL